MAVGKIFTSKEIIQAPSTLRTIRLYNIGDNELGLTAECDSWVNIIDLTKMFGSGNEPSTVEEFEAMFPNDYYPYNEGTLMSMGTKEVVEQGKNYFDFSKVPPGDIMGTDGGEIVVDHDKKTITIPSKTYYANLQRSLHKLCPNIVPGTYIITVNRSNAESVDFLHILGGVGRVKLNTPVKLTNKDLNCDVIFYNNNYSEHENVISNIQIEKASTATAYTQYTEHTYTLPQAILNIEGYGWGAGNAYNYVDYENKKFIKNVGNIDLGSLDWYAESDLSSLYRARLNSMLFMGDLICSKYEGVKVVSSTQIKQGQIASTNSQQLNFICVRDNSFTDAEALKQSLQGVYLYYELKTPIITDILDVIGDTFQEPFEVEGGGSLTFKNTNGDGYQLAVPSNVQYTIKLNEVTS